MFINKFARNKSNLWHQSVMLHKHIKKVMLWESSLIALMPWLFHDISLTILEFQVSKFSRKSGNPVYISSATQLTYLIKHVRLTKFSLEVSGARKHKPGDVRSIVGDKHLHGSFSDLAHVVVSFFHAQSRKPQRRLSTTTSNTKCHTRYQPRLFLEHRNNFWHHNDSHGQKQ